MQWYGESERIHTCVYMYDRCQPQPVLMAIYDTYIKGFIPLNPVQKLAYCNVEWSLKT